MPPWEKYQKAGPKGPWAKYAKSSEGEAPPESEKVREALAELSQLTQDMTPAGAYKKQSTLGKIATAADDTMRLIASGASFGFADKVAAGGDPGKLIQERILTEAARERAGLAGTVSELGGAVATPLGLAGRGATLVGSGARAIPGVKGIAARTGLMGAEGAGYGALSAAGNDEDIATGAGFGALAGAAGNVLGEGISALGTKASQALRAARATPEERAANAVYKAANRVGTQQALSRLDELGPEAMAVDVLGKAGTSLARQASNISPEAREVLEAALSGRKAGQNTRLVADIERAAGLPAGNRQGVDELKRAAYARLAPQINEAYEAARAAGADLPREPFRAILETPMGREAYEQAANSLKNRIASHGFKANSELARLDETKRILDSKASAAYRAGDNNTGEQAAGLARALRETMDATIAGPEYAAARALRREAYDTDKAFDLGESLASPHVPLGLPGSASKVAEANRAALAQGYGAKMADRLLNRSATEGALNALSTPMAREGMEAALGARAADVAKGLQRERAFNSVARDITGNSTTVRQLLETGLGTGAASMLFGLDPYSSGVAGIAAALLRKGGPAIARKLATKSQQKAAPYMAEILTRRAIPTTRPIPEAALERLSKSKRDAIIRALMGAGIFASPATQ